MTSSFALTFGTGAKQSLKTFSTWGSGRSTTTFLELAYALITGLGLSKICAGIYLKSLSFSFRSEDKIDLQF